MKYGVEDFTQKICMTFIKSDNHRVEEEQL